MTEPLDLEAIEARANAATDGPWKWDYDPSNDGDRGELANVNGVPAVLSAGWGECVVASDADAAFISHARTDIPVLIAEVRRLRDHDRKTQRLRDDLLRADQVDAELERLRHEFSVAQQQGTACAGCGVFKHTPVRRDSMGGYVCGGCLERELDRLRDELHETSRDTQGLAEENDSLRAELHRISFASGQIPHDTTERDLRLGLASAMADNMALRAEVAASEHHAPNDSCTGSRICRSCLCDRLSEVSAQNTAAQSELADLRRVVAELDEDGRMHTEMIRGMAIELGELRKPFQNEALSAERGGLWGSEFIGPCPHGRDPWNRCDTCGDAVEAVLFKGVDLALLQAKAAAWDAYIIARSHCYCGDGEAECGPCFSLGMHIETLAERAEPTVESPKAE